VEVQCNANLEPKLTHLVYRLSLLTSCVDLLGVGLSWRETSIFILLCTLVK